MFIISFTLEGGVGTSKSVIDGLRSYLVDRVPTDSVTGFKFSELTDTSVALLYSIELIQRIVVSNPEPALNSSFYASKLRNPAYKQNFTLSNLSFVQGFNQFKAARLQAKLFGGESMNAFIKTQDGPQEVERKMLKYLSDVSQRLGNQSAELLERVVLDLLFYNPEVYSAALFELRYESTVGQGYSQSVSAKTFPAGEIFDDPQSSFEQNIVSFFKYLGFIEFIFFSVEFIAEVTEQVQNSIRDRIFKIEPYEAVSGLYFLVMVIHFVYYVRVVQTAIKTPSELLQDETTFDFWLAKVTQQKDLQEIQGILMVLASLRLIMMLMAKFYELFQLLKVTFRKTGSSLVSFTIVSVLVFLSFLSASILLLPQSEPIFNSVGETASILLQSILGQPEFTTNSLKRPKSADIWVTIISVLFFLYFTAFAFEYLLGMQYSYYVEVQKKYKIPIMVKYKFLESRNLSLFTKLWLLLTFQFKTKDFEAEDKKRELSRLVERGEFIAGGKMQEVPEELKRSMTKETITSFRTPMSKMDRISPMKQSFIRSSSVAQTPMSPGPASPYMSPAKQKLQAILKQGQSKGNQDVLGRSKSKADQMDSSKYLLAKTDLKEIFTMNLTNFITQSEESFYSRNLYLTEVKWISAAIQEEIVSDYRERVDEYKETLVTNFATCILYLLYILLYSTITSRHLNVEESLKFNTAYEEFVNRSTFLNPRYVGQLNFNQIRQFSDLVEQSRQPTFIINNLTYNERPTYLIGRLAKQSYFMADMYYNLTSPAGQTVHWVGSNKRLESRYEVNHFFLNSTQKQYAILESELDDSVVLWTYVNNPQLAGAQANLPLATGSLMVGAEEVQMQVSNDTNPYLAREVG